MIPSYLVCLCSVHVALQQAVPSLPDVGRIKLKHLTKYFDGVSGVAWGIAKVLYMALGWWKY